MHGSLRRVRHPDAVRRVAGGDPGGHADEVLDVQVEDVAPVEVVEDRRGRLLGDPVQAPDLVVLAPRALRDLETVLLVDRLGDELGICHRCASSFGSGAAEPTPPRAALNAGDAPSVAGTRPSSRARPVLAPARPGSASSAAAATGASTPWPSASSSASARSLAIRSSAKSGANPFDAGCASSAPAKREARAKHAGVAGRSGEELVQRCRVELLANRDRAGLRERRHCGAGDEVVAELRRLAGAVPADVDDEAPSNVEQRLRPRKGLRSPPTMIVSVAVLGSARPAAHGRIEDIEPSRVAARRRASAGGLVDRSRRSDPCRARPRRLSPEYDVLHRAGDGSDEQHASACAAASAGSPRRCAERLDAPAVEVTARRRRGRPRRGAAPSAGPSSRGR